MSNPVFTTNKVFTQRTPAGYPSMPGYQVGEPSNTTPPTQEQYATYTAQNTAAHDSYYAKNTAVSAQSRPLTLDDVLIKTVISFGVLLLGGAAAWFSVSINPPLGTVLILGGSLTAFVLAMINSFKQKISPPLILSYAFFEGLALGAISYQFSYLADGAVPKAIVATLTTTLVMLVLFKTKLIRNSPTLMRIVFIGMASIAAFYLVNLVISLISPSWSMYTTTIAGFPVWIIVSLIAIVLAALSLVSDFDFIARAVDNQAPQETAWTAAFGLMVTLVWLYLEFLKLFTYFAASDN